MTWGDFECTETHKGRSRNLSMHVLCLRLPKRGRPRKTARVTGLHELAQPVTPAVTVRSSEYLRER